MLKAFSNSELRLYLIHLHQLKNLLGYDLQHQILFLQCESHCLVLIFLGRLNEDSLKIIKDCGISIDNGKDQLKTSARNFPLEIFYLRNCDIPQYLKDGVVDIAIIGENVLIEKGEDISLDRKSVV